MNDDPCDAIIRYSDFIKWANLTPGNGIAKWYWPFTQAKNGGK